MFAAFRSARRKSSQLAMAVALAGGAAFGTAAIAPAAVAQDYSRGFVEVYQPAAELTQGEAPNFEGARAQLDAVYAAIQTEDDRHAAGNLTLIVGNQLGDAALQRRGLEMMLESGKAAPEQVPTFNFYVGNLAYNAQDYAAARAAINAAVAAGYVDTDTDPLNDPEYIILQSYFSEDNPEQGVTYLTDLAETRMAAGEVVPERWLLRGLQEAYDFDLGEQALDVSEYLVQMYPSQQNWVNSLQVIGALYEFEPDTRVDLLRLMRITNSLTQRPEYVRYIEDLDPRIMGNEVLAVFEQGLENGIFESSDPYYVEVRGIAQPRAQADRNSIEDYVAEGEAGDAVDAMSTADVLLSVEDYARAETFYALAAERGYDRNAAMTRVGIAQAMQGKHAEAVATLADVSGANAPIARMWAAYAEAQTAQ